MPESGRRSAIPTPALRDSLIVFLASFGTRIAVWKQIRSLPIVRSPQLDSFEYLDWARRIAGGDFAWPAPPPHGPGYPYFLGFLLAITGSLAVATIFQAALGAGTCVIAASIGRRYFGRPAGLLSGLLLAFCGVAAFLDVSLYSEGLLLFLATAALAVLGRDEFSGRRAAAAGALVGAAALVRPTALVLLPIFAWTIFRRAGKSRRALGLVAVTVAAAAVFVVPVTLVNLRATGAPLLVQGHGGFNFFIGNSPFRDGLPSVRPGAEWDRLEGEALRHGALTASDQDRYFVRKTLAEIRANPVEYVKLLGAKLFWTIQADDVRDPFSFAFFRQQAPLLRYLLGFGVLFPLAVMGALSAARARPRPALLFAAAGAWIATDVILVTSFRYRAPVLPLLAIFAAEGAVRLATAARAVWSRPSRFENWRRAAFPALTAVAAIGVTRLAVHAPSHRFAEEWSATGFALNHEHDSPGAEAAFRRAIASDPQWSPAWAGLGIVEANRGENVSAEENLKKAIALEPNAVMPSLTLAGLYERTGRTREAEAEWRRALLLSPREPAALEGLAGTLLGEGHAVEAAEVARRAAEVAPRSAPARVLLARSLGAVRLLREAQEQALVATELDPAGAEAWFTLGMLRLDAGNTTGAREALDRAAAAGASPRNVELARALVLRADRDLDGAERALQNLVAADPRDVAARNLLAAIRRDRAAAAASAR